MYLIGDIKFLFTMMGRDGCSGAWCIYKASGPQYREITMRGSVIVKPACGQLKSYMLMLR
jgi:hypothetical protein